MGVFGGSFAFVLQGETTPDSGAGLISIGGTTFPVIITTYDRQKTEKTQIVEAFGENIHLYAFGSNAEILSLGGHILSSPGANKNMNQANELLLQKYNDKFRAFQAAQSGKTTTVTGPGDLSFSGVAQSIRYNMTSSVDCVMNFEITLIGVSGAAGVSVGTVGAAATSSATVGASAGV